jgi:Phosphotransferase enzyme family
MAPPFILPVSSQELRHAVERVLSKHFGAKRRVKSLRRRRSAYSSSYAIENLRVELDHGRQLRLVFKDLSPQSMLGTARQVRPRFLYQPRREIEIYRRILHRQGLGTPLCYGAIDLPEQERYWLFLERVDGPLLWQRGRLEPWEEAARWLARLHSQFNSNRRNDQGAALGNLICYNEELFYTWLERAQNFLRGKYASHSPHLWARFEHLAARYDRVIRRLLQLPTSFIHGEFFPSNIILRHTKSGWQICPVDWEVAAVGPGLLDLAALTSGNWKPEQKAKLVQAYREALEPYDGWPPPLPQLLEHVDYCLLHLSIQLLGWSSDWEPPERHTQNWFGEALRLTEVLGL